MPLEAKPPTAKTPHNKSDRARGAEVRGEHTWSNWRLADLIEQVLRVNKRRLSARDLKAVGNLEIVKVKLLEPTGRHHTKLRMPEPLTNVQDQFFGVTMKVAENLDSAAVASWRGSFSSSEELDEAVVNLTGRVYYRRVKL